MRQRRGLVAALLLVAVGAAASTAASDGPAARAASLTGRRVPIGAALPQAAVPVRTAAEAGPDTAARAISIPAVGFSQEGIGKADAHGSVEPADVTLGVGPTYLGEAVNSSVGWWRIGAGYDASKIVQLGQFFSTGAVSRRKDRMAHPRLLYDPTSGRWFFTAFDLTRKELDLGVSQTSDPTRPFWIFNAPAAGCPDQPRLAVSGTLVALSYDVLASCDKPAVTGGVLQVWTKAPLLKGAVPPTTSFGPSPLIANTTPAPSVGGGTAIYMLSADYTNSQIVLFTVDKVGEANIPLQRVAINPLRQAPPPPQRGSSTPLDAGGNRVQDAFYSGGHIWLAANDGCSVPGPVPVQGCVRYVELTPSGQVLSEVDQALANGRSAVAPAMRPDGHGHLFSVFGYTSPSDYPGLAATVDPNVSNAYLQLKPGQGADRSGHWGSYFAAARDPRHANRIWVAGAYGQPGGWGTYIAALSTAAFSISAPGTGTGGRDRIAPQVRALRSTGVRGRPVRLMYRPSDNSHQVRTTITVRHRGRVVAIVQTPLASIVNGRRYWAVWRSSTSAPTAASFCVVAYDPSGNRSRPSCAPLRLGGGR